MKSRGGALLSWLAVIAALALNGCGGEKRTCAEWETHYVTKSVTDKNGKKKTHKVPVRTCGRYEESKETHAP
ncbi:hypothetical protein ACH4FX_12075 [Streptomyces sp. NPDC018019]|uniref:hypothetical protein n=1 Tax=Streptomyces sp. NPDC018019 TaxID=3365030 RepID=UPI0037B79E44